MQLQIFVEHGFYVCIYIYTQLFWGLLRTSRGFARLADKDATELRGMADRLTKGHESLTEAWLRGRLSLWDLASNASASIRIGIFRMTTCFTLFALCLGTACHKILDSVQTMVRNGEVLVSLVCSRGDVEGFGDRARLASEREGRQSPPHSAG